MRLFNAAEEDAVIAAMRAVRKAHGDGTNWLLVRVQDGKAMEMIDRDELFEAAGRERRDAFFNLGGGE